MHKSSLFLPGSTWEKVRQESRENDSFFFTFFFACKRISLNCSSERVILCLPMGKPPRSTQLAQIPEEPMGAWRKEEREWGGRGVRVRMREA